MKGGQSSCCGLFLGFSLLLFQEVQAHLRQEDGDEDARKRSKEPKDGEVPSGGLQQQRPDSEGGFDSLFISRLGFPGSPLHRHRDSKEGGKTEEEIKRLTDRDQHGCGCICICHSFIFQGRKQCHSFTLFCEGNTERLSFSHSWSQMIIVRRKC